MNQVRNRQAPRVVLAIGDAARLVPVLEKALPSDGFRVVEAGSCSQALSVFEAEHPDVVVLDVPEIDRKSLGTYFRLRCLPAGYKTPVLLFVTPDEDGQVDCPFVEGITDFVTYPVNPDVVRYRIDCLLGSPQSKEAILRAKQEWEATVDGVSDMIILTNLRGEIVRCNRSTIERVSSTYQEIIGSSIQQVIFGTSEDQEDEASIGGEMEISHLGGFFDVSFYPIKLQEGQKGVVYVIKDITQRKRIHARMLASQKLADLGTLAAGVAHEINSPLQVVTGSSESLLKRLEQGMLDMDCLERNLKAINRNGWRCAEIVRALRAYAYSSDTKFEPHDLNVIVHDTLLLIENQLRSWSNISIVTELEPNLPQLPCDRNQITQIIINLLTNARDAMPTGGKIIVGTGFDSPTSRLILRVSDAGVGIPKEIRANLFDPFFTTKPLGHGTGLGLSIVSGIVNAHGGAIQVKSEIDHGSTFTLYFPQAAPKIHRPSSPVLGRFSATKSESKAS